MQCVSDGREIKLNLCFHGNPVFWKLNLMINKYKIFNKKCGKIRQDVIENKKKKKKKKKLLSLGE